jgi:transposase
MVPHVVAPTWQVGVDSTEVRGYKAAVPMHASTPTPLARIAELEALLSAERERSAQLEKEREVLRASHERLRLELELLKRRLFVAKAERVDTGQLELEFAQKLRALEEVAGTLAMASGQQAEGESDQKKKKKRKPSGRRDLKGLPLEEKRVEIGDPLFEELVAQGKAERIGFEESYKLAWQRGGMRRLVVARIKYRALGREGEAQVETARVPPEVLPRSLAAPSLLAHVLSQKFCDGLPLHRLEDRAARDGVPLDRGTMSRWVEEAGASVGATVVAAAREEAMRTAFCIATDATGIAVQPEKRPDGARQACRRGHYFVLLADKDHVFFEYTPRETSAAVEELFRGYSGYIQADAKSVYDVLFRQPDTPPNEHDGRDEVGCWAHCRRKFWEATCAKSEVAREGLARIGRLFALEEAWSAEPPETRHRLRNAHLRPHLEAFFRWAQDEYSKVRDERGLLRSALGYAVRQQQPLLRLLDDGRLVLDNNRSERELRRIAVGRKAWLFVGSDGHAQSAGNILSLVASARLHRLDPEAYLRDLFRVLAHWPRQRYLELAPRYWASTRARLDSQELAAELGPLTVPPPLLPAPEQEAAANGSSR